MNPAENVHPESRETGNPSDLRAAQIRLQLVRQALRQTPRSPALLYRLYEALAETGADSEAASAFREVCRVSSMTTLQLCALPGAGSSVIPGQLRERALALLNQGVAFSPVIAALAAAEALLGRKAELERLVDFGLSFKCEALPTPGGLESAVFHRRLAEEVKSHLTYDGEGQQRAIQKGWRFTHFFESRLPMCQILVDALRARVDRYMAELRLDPAHPLVVSRPAEFHLEGWGVVSNGATYHRPHIHPKAWASGVYYVVRPPVSRQPGSHRGWLRVGPPHGLAPESGWAERLVAPEPGTLVLMPGYFYHGTEPMEVDEERICIAFDVVPSEIPGGA